MTVVPKEPTVKCKATLRMIHFAKIQCSRNASRDGYCGMHHPKAVAARTKRAEEKRRARVQWIIEGK